MVAIKEHIFFAQRIQYDFAVDFLDAVFLIEVDIELLGHCILPFIEIGIESENIINLRVADLQCDNDEVYQLVLNRGVISIILRNALGDTVKERKRIDKTLD